MFSSNIYYCVEHTQYVTWRPSKRKFESSKRRVGTHMANAAKQKAGNAKE